MKYHHGNLKENLIQQAVLACEESGWENISLRNLAKQLNVSQTAPYRHFETKEDLLAEVAAKGFEKMNADMNKTSNFLASGLAYCDFALKYQNTYDLMTGNSLGSFTQYPALLDQAQSAFITLENNLEAHLINLGHSDLPKDIIEEKALSVWAFMHGIVGILRKTETASEDAPASEGPMKIMNNLSKNWDEFIEKSIKNILSI
jgi:AcrR family transcriptional regulator